jgi:hypothetical protein
VVSEGRIVAKKSSGLVNPALFVGEEPDAPADVIRAIPSETSHATGSEIGTSIINLRKVRLASSLTYVPGDERMRRQTAGGD